MYTLCIFDKLKIRMRDPVVDTLNLITDIINQIIFSASNHIQNSFSSKIA